MKNISFKFYSVLKNEDAIPYIGGNLLVTADGLGGSGSTVHTIDRTKHDDMHNEIMSGALGDFQQISSELSQYIEELITPMTDNANYTSALWASRIVIARCVYALTEGEFKDANLDEEKVRSSLAEFIAKGLHGIAETFDLNNGKYDNQLLLPTTLAFIRYTEENDSVIAEAVWAGDSRLYALMPSGLKLLSVDDEDDSGAITNLFYADNQKIQLNYLRHELEKPCILMAVSDGVFDPFDHYDHLGVEYTLLNAITESNSEQELADKLRGFYDSVHGDDATMAFVSLGFADFAEIKEALKNRTETILTIRHQQAEMYPMLEVMNLSEEEATHYVATRTKDRYSYIIPILLDAIDNGTDDIAISEEIRNIVEGAKRTHKTFVEKFKKEKRELAFDELNKYVLSHPEPVAQEILNHTQLSDKDKNLMDKYTAFKKASDIFLFKLNNFKLIESREEEFAARKSFLHNQIQTKIVECRKCFDDMWNAEDSKENENRRADILNISSVWGCIDNSLKFGSMFPDTRKLTVNDKKLADDVWNFISDYREWYSQKNSCLRAIKGSRISYENRWRCLYEYLKCDERLLTVLLSSDTIHKCGFDLSDEAVALAIGKSIRDCLITELNNNKTNVINCIVRALATEYNKTSVIDAQYNATKLEQFRTYFRLQNNPNSGIKEFENKLLAIESDYTSLVDHAKF